MGTRQQIRAVLTIDPNFTNITPCVMPSLEIMNNGEDKTLVFYPGNLTDGIAYGGGS